MIFQSGLEMGEDPAEQPRGRRFERIVNPLAGLPGADQPGLADDLKVGGQRGLRDPEGVAQLANAQLPAAQCGENTHAGGVG